MEELSTVKLSSIKKLVEAIEAATKNEDTEVGMEFLITAFFPDSYDNLRKIITEEYIRGYNDGKAAAEEEMEDDLK